MKLTQQHFQLIGYNWHLSTNSSKESRLGIPLKHIGNASCAIKFTLTNYNNRNHVCLFLVHCGIKLQINKRKKSDKFPNTNIKNILLNKEWVKEDIQGDI
jgi:hypothetical protein